jgi:hypothetical protein
MRGEDILARGEEEKRREDNGLRIEGGRERERERERRERKMKIWEDERRSCR